MITAGRSGRCRTCDGPIARDEPWFGDGADAHHLACALQVLPLQLADALAAYRDSVPDRAAIEQIARLWLDVVANPDDDAPRLVLADLLQTRGDPRGELIALQLAGAEPARCNALVAEHGVRWLWRQRKVALAAEFARGFVARLQLSRDAALADPDDPALGTVEDLAFASIGTGPANGDAYARYVRSPAMRALRRIEVWDVSSLAAFERTPAKIAHVGCELWRSDVDLYGARFINACLAQPTLHSLALHVAGFQTLAMSRVLPQLTELTLVGRLGAVLPLWKRLPPETTLVLTLSAKLAPCYGDSRGSLELRRDDGALVARASGDWARPGLIARLPDLSRITFEGADPETEQAIRAEAIGLDVVFEPARVPSGRWLRGV